MALQKPNARITGKSIEATIMEKMCLTCNRVFFTKDKRQKYCSFACVYDKNSERNNIIRKQKIGIKYSEAYKKKMSERCKGLNVWRKGQKMSDVAKGKISQCKSCHQKTHGEKKRI